MLAYFDQNLWDSTLPSDEYIAKFKNKNLLLINAGPRLKYLVLKRIRDLGVGKIIVLDTANGWFSEQVDDTIACDDSFSPLLDPENPESDPRIQSILAYTKEHNITFDGVWTFADKSVVLCAQIADFLGVSGIDPRILAQLKNKQTLREWLFLHQDHLTQDCPHVRSLPCIDYSHIVPENFPLILKGVESVGKSLINVIRNTEDLNICVDKHGLKSITLEPYFEGTDIDLNLIVKNGKIVWSGFVENFAPKQPGFLENGSMTCQCINDEEKEEVVRYTQRILDHARGVQTACLHVEFRIRHDENGFSFTLIEINFRMGGGENFVFPLGQDNYDLILSNLELAFGMPLTQVGRVSGSGMYPYMKTADLYTTKKGILKHLAGPKDTSKILEYLFFAEVGMECDFPPRGCVLDEIGWIVAGSSVSQEEADHALDTAVQDIVIDIS